MQAVLQPFWALLKKRRPNSGHCRILNETRRTLAFALSSSLSSRKDCRSRGSLERCKDDDVTTTSQRCSSDLTTTKTALTLLRQADIGPHHPLQWCLEGEQHGEADIRQGKSHRSTNYRRSGVQLVGASRANRELEEAGVSRKHGTRLAWRRQGRCAHNRAASFVDLGLPDMKYSCPQTQNADSIRSEEQT